MIRCAGLHLGYGDGNGARRIRYFNTAPNYFDRIGTHPARMGEQTVLVDRPTAIKGARLDSILGYAMSIATGNFRLSWWRIFMTLGQRGYPTTSPRPLERSRGQCRA